MVHRSLDGDALPEGEHHSSEQLSRTEDVMTTGLGSTSPMAEIIDRNKPGGWMVRASVLGGFVQTFYVYELDDRKAASLARTAIAATNGELVDAVKLLNIHELEDHGVKPGEVKKFI